MKKLLLASLFLILAACMENDPWSPAGKNVGCLPESECKNRNLIDQSKHEIRFPGDEKRQAKWTRHKIRRIK